MMNIEKIIIYLLALYFPVRSFAQPSNERWVLAFEDNFDGPMMDKSKWDTHYPATYVLCSSNGTSFEQGYNQENYDFSSEPGKIGLYVKKESVDKNIATSSSNPNDLVPHPCNSNIYISNQQHFEYTTGMLYSRYQFKYGRFEIRFKAPSGAGFYTSFWLYGNGAEEIDAFEIQEGGTNILPTNYHCNNGCTEPHETGQDIMMNGDFADDYNVVCIDWSPDKIIYSVNGIEVRWVDKTFNNPMNIIITESVGNDIPASWGSASEGTVLGTYYIDYVKVWNKIDCDATIEKSYIANDPNETVITGNDITVITNSSGTGLIQGTNYPNNLYLNTIATNSITLGDGFEAKAGTTFCSNITTCPSVGFTNNTYGTVTPLCASDVWLGGIINKDFDSPNHIQEASRGNMAVSNSGSDIWYRGMNNGMDNVMQHEYWFEGYWTNETPMPTTNNVAGDIVIDGNLLNGKNIIYYHGSDNRIHKMWYTGTNWTETIYCTNGCSGNVQGSLAILPNNGVIYKSTDNKVYGMWVNGATVTPIEIKPGATPIAAGPQSRDIAVDDAGDIYYRASDNKIHKLFYTTAWNEINLMIGFTGNVDGHLALLSAPNNGCLYKGTDKKIWGIWNNGGIYTPVKLISNQSSNVAGFLVTNNGVGTSKVFYQIENENSNASSPTSTNIHYMTYDYTCSCWIENTLSIPVGSQVIKDSDEVANSNDSNLGFLIFDKPRNKLYYRGNDTYTDAGGTTWYNHIHGFYQSCQPQTWRMANASFEENEDLGNNKISIFPNPNIGLFTLSTVDENVRNIYVYDLLGKVVYQKEGIKQQKLDIDISSQPNGIYFVRCIDAEGKTEVVKIIKN